jgi:Tol biopolymer transport system component
MPGAPPRLVMLTTYEGAELHPALSPDGQQVAFSWEGRDLDARRPQRHIWLKFVGGSELRQLTTGEGNDSYPSWSPDGREIAYLRMPLSPGPGRRRIHVVSVLGGPERELSDFPAALSQLVWASDASGIIAAREGVGREDDSASGAIHLVRRGGEPSRTLTRPAPGWFDAHPAVSRDGGVLAWASCDSGPPALRPCHAHRADLVSGAPQSPTRLTQTPFLATGLAWAPDAGSVVLSSYGGPRKEGLWRVAARGGSTPERVELAGRRAMQPFVSAAHGRLVFSTAPNSGQIWALDDGGRTRPLMASLQEWTPAFSPDGRHIVFQSSRSGENTEIWVADADGRNPVQVTAGPGWWQGSPRWSPDGRRVVFDSRGDSGYAHVWTVEVANGSVRRVTDGPLSEGQAGWSPDGRFIYYRADRPDGSDIWRVPEAGGTPERLTDGGAFNPLVLSDGRTLLYTRRRLASPLVEKDIETGSEQQVVDCVFGRSFDVRGGALYFVGCPDAERDLPLHRLDRRTGRRELLGRVSASAEGIAVAPSGWPILFEQVTAGGDLMLIENFR